MKAGTADVQIENHGSIILFQPLSAMARDWLTENTNAEAWQWVGDALAVEPRMAGDLAQGLADNGFSLE